MSFITPWLLLGGLLVGVPIVLHLVMRQRPKHLIFPALRFIKQRQETNQRKLRLKHLLLLLLRCAAIVLLAVAVARPIVQSSSAIGNGGAPVAAALVFDTGPRMEYREKNQTRLEAAAANGKWLVKQLPSESDVAVFDSSSTRTGFDVDRSAAALRIDQLRITPSPRRLADSVAGALTLLETSKLEQKEVFVFTDLARTDWIAEASTRWKQQLAAHPDVNLYLVDVGVTDPENFSLNQITLSGEVVSQNSSLIVQSDLAVEGDGGERAVRLYLQDADGVPQPRGQELFRVEPDGAAFIEFRIGNLKLGTHQGHLQIVDDDALAADNVRYFSVEVKKPWQVLVVAPEPAQQYAQYVVAAISPPRFRKSGQAQFECKVVALNTMQEETLDTYDAVWLLNPTPLDADAWQQLASFVARGGGLAIALGGKAGFSGQKFNDPAALDLLPGPLAIQQKEPGGNLFLAPVRLEHPVLTKFKQVDTRIPWIASPISKYWKLGPLAKDVQVVLPYNNGEPALLERGVGQGRVLMLTTSLTESTADRFAWNYLLVPRAESWPGFVLVLGMAHHLVGSVDERLNFAVGDSAEVRLSAAELADTYWLITPEGDRLKIRRRPAENSLAISTTLPGHYQITAGGEQGVRRGLSTNLRPRLTQLARASEEELKAALGERPLTVARGQKELASQRKISKGRSRWELYPWLILLLVLVLAGEQVLSSFFYRRNESAG